MARCLTSPFLFGMLCGKKRVVESVCLWFDSWILYGYVETIQSLFGIDINISVVITIIGILFSAHSFAEENAMDNSKEREKRKIVSRLYQATYGSIERCKKAAPEEATEFESEFNRFVSENEKLMKLVTQSPYYEYAINSFSKHAAVDPLEDTTESFSAECKYLSSMLHSMSLQKEGRYSIKEITEILEK